MKIKKLFGILTFAIILTFSFGFTECLQSDYKYRNVNVSALEYTTPIEFENASIGEMAEEYLQAIATVRIIDSTNSVVSFGSGIAIYRGGYIATNYHVINKVAKDESNTFKISLEVYNGTDFQHYDAKLVWYDENLDIAIVKSENTIQMKFVKMMDRWINANDDRLGMDEKIWTLGTPFDMELFGSVSEGTISSILPRTGLTTVDNREYVREYNIQFNAPISSGSSGGGLFDLKGNLVGLTTSGYTSTSANDANGLYFAAPIYPLTIIIEDVVAKWENNQTYTNVKFGFSGYDSISTKYFSDKDSTLTFTGKGFYVCETVTGSVAENAGLKMGDVIVGLATSNYDPILGIGKYYKIDKHFDLIYAIFNINKESSVKLYYSRGGVTDALNIAFTSSI